MNPLLTHFSKLISSSESILQLLEMEYEAIPVDDLKGAFNKRGRLIQELEALIKVHPVESLNNEQRTSFDSMFQSFEALSQKIQNNLTTVFKSQRDKIVSIARQKEAEKRYTLSRRPEISYY